MQAGVGGGPAAARGFAKPVGGRGAGGGGSQSATAATKSLELAAAEPAEWRAWLDETAAASGIGGSTFYVQVQMDGRVRASGAGSPPWDRFVTDLAPTESLLTRLTDGSAR